MAVSREARLTADAASPPDRLPRRLGLWSAIAVAVGSTIGSGIFRVPSTVAAEVGTLGALAIAWGIGAVVALFGALTLAELATMYPRSGGIYVFLREAYEDFPQDLAHGGFGIHNESTLLDTILHLRPSLSAIA